MLMAVLVDEGRASLDVSAFSPDRFDPRESELFLRTPMAQRDLARRPH